MNHLKICDYTLISVHQTIAMRLIPFTISLLITCLLIAALSKQWTIGGVKAPAFGSFFSPQHGFWQNAEATDHDFSSDLKFPQLAGKVEVYFDDRLVPHVFAEKTNDVYFVQGYLHAKFRLWQMELQTFAAGGRVSEIIGEKGLEHDREFRRLGMVYAAEIAQQEMEKDPEIKAECDAYTAGVNAYINSLTESTLPVEYKLLGYKPELWSNLKTSLFLKYMSYDLASHENDIEMTNAKSYFSADDFAKLFPAVQDSLDPIIPKNSIFEKQKVFPIAPAGADSVYMNSKEVAINEIQKADPENGSNNWAVSGSKTVSGAPILCNDPHLGLNLPSLWYEMQLSTPEFNAYGATFPGAPSVIIGFNDHAAFGFTNGGRDVRDYYEIKFKDNSRKEYWFDSAWRATTFRVDTIGIKDQSSFIDSVAYTVFGPVMFDKSYSGKRNMNDKYYAVRWTAHDPSNELKIFTLLNKAKDYADYSAAVTNLHTPGQNCVFACKNGDIAIRTQGEWPAKWKGQGDFIMPGIDSSYMWQAMIPQDEVPFQYNPERGFVSSANQKPVDESYPYYIGREYPPYRGITINKRLSDSTKFTPEAMMKLQTNTYDGFAATILPLLLKNIQTGSFNSDEAKYYELLKGWNLHDDVGAKGATVFEVTWKKFMDTVFNDEYTKAPAVIMRPLESSVAEGLLKDSAYKFLDNIATTQVETLADNITAAFKKAAQDLKKIEADNRLDWEKYNGVGIRHLGFIPAFSRLNLTTSGGSHAINANRNNHGPSWRMVVSLTEKTEAYGVYPGGQSGNPGSRFYDNFVDHWAAGKYYSLWMMTKDEVKDNRLKWKMIFGKG